MLGARIRFGRKLEEKSAGLLFLLTARDSCNYYPLFIGGSKVERIQ